MNKNVDLPSILAAHRKWLLGESGGVRANLSRANLRGDIPVVPNVHRALYDAISRNGCHLDMTSWHTCETTHCRAGWLIVCAGEAGAALEAKIGPSAAAALIYQASDPTLERVPDFHASDNEAMADIKRLAGQPAVAMWHLPPLGNQETAKASC